MIAGGWSFIYAAYALTVLLLGGLAVIVLLRARHWSREARKLDKRQ
jgi:heme exporter protein CcmD